MACLEDISYMDDDDVSSSSTSSASVLCAPTQRVSSARRGQPPHGMSAHDSRAKKGPSVVSVVANTSSVEGEKAVRATLNILPNLGDNSDAESIVDNSLAYAGDPAPASDNKILNNLDKKTTVKLTDENKFFIPHIPDLFYSEKDCKSAAGDDGQETSKNTAAPPVSSPPFGEDVGVKSRKSFELNLRGFPSVESNNPDGCRGTVGDINASFRTESTGSSRHVSSENFPPNIGARRARAQVDQLPPMARSDSISSLASEVSSCAGEGGAQRRRSSGLASADGDAARVRPRSSKRRRSSLKPRFKRTFADATLQYIKDRLEGRVFSGWLEERQRLENVVKFPSNYGGVVEEEMWRDVVEVDACEVEMVTQLDAVLASVPGAKDGQKWINIQPPGAVQGYLLWLVLEGEPRPPQHYWFKLHSVTSHPLTGLQLHVSVIRRVGETDAESPMMRSRRLAAAAAAAAGDVPLTLSLAWQQLTSSVRKNFTGDLVGQYAVLALQPSNVAYAFRMVVFAVVSVVVGTLHCMRELSRFFLLFMREAGWLIDRATPAFQIVVNFVEKIIGGFFVLIAMVYKDVRRPANPQPPPSIAPPFTVSPRAIRDRRFVSQQAWRACECDT